MKNSIWKTTFSLNLICSIATFAVTIVFGYLMLFLGAIAKNADKQAKWVIALLYALTILVLLLSIVIFVLSCRGFIVRKQNKSTRFYFSYLFLCFLYVLCAGILGGLNVESFIGWVLLPCALIVLICTITDLVGHLKEKRAIHSNEK